MEIPVEEVLVQIAQVVGSQYVLRDASVLASYGADGFTLENVPPRAVILPGNADEVAETVRLLAGAGVPFLARGAGTSLSGGAIARQGAVIVHLSRMSRILSVDLKNGMVECEPGVVNRTISQRVAPDGFFYAPDPSSGQACTIGGNVAENAGGPHCLKYGVTANHILMVELVLADGERVRVGHLAAYPDPIDFLGLMLGSEGTFAVVTRVWVRVIRIPPSQSTVMALFDQVAGASQAVSAIISAGIIPASIEMMDQLAISAVEQGTYRVGYPPDVAAVLLIEVDGSSVEVQSDTEAVLAILAKFHPRSVQTPHSEAERDLWWANRKTAFGAMGLISPRYYVQDGVIPRSRLPEVLERIAAIAERYRIRIANVFHAGDGNLHPLLLYDDRDPDQVARVIQAGSEVLRVCVEVGGSITGEHGVGLEKLQEMSLQFSPEELQALRGLKASFDPQGLLNPGKVLPESP
ncbi:MAG: FAD-binding protein [Firmicutes bacterium]|jgi:glycolate oxidase|nr:FAD-binding protein [Bacillota bacterium]